MTRPRELLEQGRKEELWEMCCGFLNLRLEQFMGIQKRLLLEQIGLLENCEMGRRLLGDARPLTVEEFREQVPLTTYDDYLPELTDKREDVLPARPAIWVHTVGRIGEYNFKWVPLPDRFLHELERIAGGIGLLASCNAQGGFLAKAHLKTLSVVNSPSYGSGIVAHLMQKALACDFLPSDLDSGDMPFDQKLQAAFQEALCRGLDALGGLPSVLTYMGEAIKQGEVRVGTRFLLSHPKASLRLARGLIRSKLARRPLHPKDLWSLSVVVGGGVDSALFCKSVTELWGRQPLEVYGGTEGGLYAAQTWDHQGLTFIPNLNFLEFIPERECLKWRLDHSYQPKTVLLDEVKAGAIYELVITNFHGGVMTRYRVGDLVRITSLWNKRLGILIPQMVFHSRADDFVDVAGLGKLTERIIRQAVEDTSLPYVDWVARKEAADSKPLLHLYLELKNGHIVSEEKLAMLVRERFRQLDRRHRCNLYNLIGNMETMLDLKPVMVTLLPQGAFASYMAQRRAEGADPDHVHPTRVNPSDEVISLLKSPKVLVETIPATEAERATAR